MKKYRKRLNLAKYNNWFELLASNVNSIKDEYKILFISDCDGIITDGRSYFTDVKTHKSYGSYDKEAIRFIIDYMNDMIEFLTDDPDGFFIHKARIEHLSNSCKNESFALLSKNAQDRYLLVKNHKKDFSKEKVIVVFIGDSLSDIPALSWADIAMTTNNAPDEVKEYCNYISTYNGGMGGFADCIFHFYENFETVKSILNI